MRPRFDQRDATVLGQFEIRIRSSFRGLRDARFAEFRARSVGTSLQKHVEDIQEQLAGFDVVRLQEKLTGRTFDPTIDVVLL